MLRLDLRQTNEVKRRQIEILAINTAEGVERVNKSKTIWVQHVAVNVAVLRSRLSVATARPKGLTPEQRAAVAGVSLLLDRADAAAHRRDPVPSRVANWFGGVLVETAYRNLHAARAQIVDLYDEAEVDAEIPSAVARAHVALSRDDPRCISVAQLRGFPWEKRRAWVRRLVEDGYEGVDEKHAQLRGFRNITLYAAAVIILLVAFTVLFVSSHPSVMPLCFPVANNRQGPHVVKNCPTRTGVLSPTGGDIMVVALVGLLGGALAATVAIRKLQGSSTPYDVPVALAWLKVPLGAFTAILGLVAIQGGFIPGLSALDSQEQILAWALLLGFGQQVFTGALDKRAADLLSGVPSKDALTERPVPGDAPAPPPPGTPGPIVPPGGLGPNEPAPTEPAPTEPTPAPTPPTPPAGPESQGADNETATGAG